MMDNGALHKRLQAKREQDMREYAARRWEAYDKLPPPNIIFYAYWRAVVRNV